MQLYFEHSLNVSADGSASESVDSPDPWRVLCADMKVLTDEVASCTVPALPPSEPGYPFFTAVLQGINGAWAVDRLGVAFPSASGYVRPLGGRSLPTSFLPSFRQLITVDDAC